MNERADAIVVGLGAMGSSVTLRLAQRGLRVIGVDQFAPPHDRGSTHGETRITRLAVGEGAEHVPLVRRSHELWRELEGATSTSLFEQVGGLVIGARDNSFLQRTRAVATAHGIAHDNLSTAQLRAGYPMFEVPAGTEAYFEPEAGYLRPEAAVTAQLALARGAGARLRLDEPIRSWTASSSGVAVATGATTFEADILVLCAGAWITKLVPELAATFGVYRQTLFWFGVGRGHEALARMPVFIWEMDEGAAGVADPFAHLEAGFYGFPPVDGRAGPIKLATERYDATVDPDDRSGAAADPPTPADRAAAEAFHARYLARYFPWVAPQPVRVASCLYTCTRDSRFVIDRHPDHANVWIVSACSGHGFKHSPAIGEALAQQIADGGSRIDLRPFALA